MPSFRSPRRVSRRRPTTVRRDARSATSRVRAFRRTRPSRRRPGDRTRAGRFNARRWSGAEAPGMMSSTSKTRFPRARRASQTSFAVRHTRSPPSPITATVLASMMPPRRASSSTCSGKRSMFSVVAAKVFTSGAGSEHFFFSGDLTRPHDGVYRQCGAGCGSGRNPVRASTSRVARYTTAALPAGPNGRWSGPSGARTSARRVRACGPEGVHRRRNVRTIGGSDLPGARSRGGPARSSGAPAGGLRASPSPRPRDGPRGRAPRARAVPGPATARVSSEGHA